MSRAFVDGLPPTPGVDGMLEVTLDTRRKVTREVRRLRAELLQRLNR